MDPEESFRTYMNSLRERVDRDQFDNILRQLPAMVEIIMAMRDGKTSKPGSSSSGSTIVSFNCPNCNHAMKVTG